MTVAGRDYKGAVRVVPNDRGGCDVINILELEDFLLGVVAREMDPKGPLEALKAQAIAARSHALHQICTSGNRSCDLVANLSQAYMGQPKLNKNIVLAIETTRGQVLVFKNKCFPSYFHSSCGGHTETEADIWETKNESMLPAAVVCPWCVRSSQNRWTFKISRSALRQILKEAGLTTGPTPSLSITRKTAGGHILRITIRSETGVLALSGEKFRALLGYGNLKSTLFDASSAPRSVNAPDEIIVFHGNGFGHGVGLCQFGAEQMARQGATSTKILNHYFPKARVQDRFVSK
ncbi:MAG: SpoIID/LytB domain-containing protein [Verrucomicrobiae bacterium]|nr:SpoIID/LytB domain-containing protein [Verrucomicrobiae bacterium]